MSSNEALSLEETNKTRIALGLAPLADPSAGGEDGGAPNEEETAVENYQREKAARDAEKQTREARERLEKTRNQRELQSKLSGTGLGSSSSTAADDGSGGDSAKNWVKKSKKRAKQVAADLARRRAEEQAQMDAELQAGYGQEDLAGLRVGHSAQDFEDGEETVLTLKDSRIINHEQDDDDELVNVSLAERERTQDRLRLTKQGKQAGKYNPYADDEAEFANPGQRRGILSKYDADIPDAQEGSHSEGFTLGKVSRPSDQGEGAPFKAVGMPVQKNAEARKQVAQQLGQTLSADLSYEKNLDNSDYAQEADVGFKKGKKKKKSKKEGLGRRKDADEDADAMQTDEPLQRASAAELEQQVMQDEDALQSALSRQRQAKAKSRKNAEALKRVAQEHQARTTASPMAVDSPSGGGGGTESVRVKQEDGDEDEGGDGGGGLVLDDTSEFVRGIQLRAPSEEPPKPKRVASSPAVKPEPSPTTTPVPVDSAGIEQGEEDTPMGLAMDPEEAAAAIKAEQDGSPMQQQQQQPHDDDGFGGTSNEVLVSSGLGATLNLLKQQGLVKGPSEENMLKDMQFKDRQAWLARRRIDQADVQKQLQARRAQGQQSNPKGGQNSEQRQREMENKMRERGLASREMDRFKDYNPVFDLKYTDEYGREMNQKEAWKHLSHRFHGKASGVKKQEKRLKKVEDERRQQRMASGDTPLNVNSAFQARQEKLGSATMVLSVGNKATAPSLDEFQTTAGVEMSKQQQPKASSSKAKQQHQNGVDINLTPMLDTGSGSGYASGSGTPVDSAAAAPKRAGFKRVGKREATDSPAPEAESSKRPRQDD